MSAATILASLYSVGGGNPPGGVATSSSLARVGGVGETSLVVRSEPQDNVLGMVSYPDREGLRLCEQA